MFLIQIFNALSYYYWTIFFLLLIFIDIIAVLHILKNKHHEPTSAILWIFIVIDFHILGLIAYLLIGINRIKTKGEKLSSITENMNSMRSQKNAFLSFLKTAEAFNYKDYNTKSYQYIIDRILPESSPFTGNTIELLEDGTTAYPKMLEAIDKAKLNIHLQSFIIMNDCFGKHLFEKLEEKAKEGVKIKILFDTVGSAKAYYSNFFKTWIKKNPNMEIHPFSKFNLFAPYRIQLRNHRKLLICDGKTAFIGGINISEENVFKPKNKYIHDLHCKICGPVVGEMQYIFLRDWCFAAKTNPDTLLSNTSFFPVSEKMGEGIVRIVASGPGQSDFAAEKMFMTAAVSAEKSLWIITPYFVPDKPFINALIMTAAKGIDVRIIIPQNNNHWYVRYASRSLYNILLASNIRIFEKKGVFSHAKAMLVDNKWGYMGSSNCDVRSFRLNYELDFAVEDTNFIKEMYKQFKHELSESDEITIAQRAKRTFREEIIEDFCSLFTPIL